MGGDSAGYVTEARPDGLLEYVAIRFDIVFGTRQLKRLEGRIPETLLSMTIRAERHDLAGQDPLNSQEAGLGVMLGDLEEAGRHAAEVETSPELGKRQDSGRHRGESDCISATRIMERTTAEGIPKQRKRSIRG